MLKAANLTPERLLDPWGHRYQIDFSQQNRYWDKITSSMYSVYPNQPHKRTDVTPVTQKLAYITFTATDPKMPYNPFSVAEFSRVISEQSSKDLVPKTTPGQAPQSGGKGGISGKVTTESGPALHNVEVTATSDAGEKHTTKTDKDGVYAFANLPTGLYRIQFEGRGVQKSYVLRVPVKNESTTTLDISLEISPELERQDRFTDQLFDGVAVHGTTETVEVSGATFADVSEFGTNGRSVMQLATLSPGVAAPQSELRPGSPAAPMFTPRLRQYFPETLLWNPEVITDEKGNAQLHFPMADNITSWKMSVVASTLDGKVGIAEKNLESFQPFFIDHDPPKVLTQGDRINLPVVLRNYTAKPQKLLTELNPEPWFSPLSPLKQDVEVAANGNASAIFSFRADASTRHGKQRVTSRNTQTGDAVEREVLVHPDGQEISFTVAKTLTAQDSALEVAIPDNAIAGSSDSELRIYPNLMAHVFDAMNGIGQRPAGCAEQITSTAYVSLHALQLLKKAGQDSADPSNPRAAIAVSARKAVQEGYDQLMDLQGYDGGFPYWKTKQPDLALTAYVLRFLAQASEFVSVDPAILVKTQKYLISKQTKDGAWLRHTYWLDEHGLPQEKDVDDSNTTAYIARALALTIDAAKDKDRENVEHSLTLAMNYLEDQISSWKDAYLVGNYAIAAISWGHKQHINEAKELLAGLAHREGDATYWKLEANTSPFYGWGAAGRVESTALAVEALAMLQEKSPDPENASQISRGLQFLLSHKDPYACWYSTQATQNAIEAMIAAIPVSKPGEDAGSRQVGITVNGREVSSIKLPASTEVVGPITVELAQYLEKGNNKIEVVQPGNVAAMNTLLLASYYLPWKDSTATAHQNFQSGDTRALKLGVQFSRQDPKIGETVHCNVNVERIGFRGYGMMLAEIGLPPGSDVDRASLHLPIWVQGYEVQPDRIVFYVWPEAGGTDFSFDFRVRYSMEAMSTASVLYDYYNPEASATVVPVQFSVH